ncbi:sirohydrochlorin chelatase [Georgenia satyanarayanai]|uniref:sirohydrochlorin chelatase n=1 Tax=Georgenia satyanarayanai TaxID=860221 RepID=UPI00203F4BAD|nr:sirohydrochlorin chelatase [Georgenia satyanarayanai]MCM3661880.1 sirohydrochlorin chelatase [Georgenia satyanarayanai]
MTTQTSARLAPERSGAAAPVLVGCSHGTNDDTGRQVVRSILDDVRAARPGLNVREAFVDVQQPEVADVVASVVTGDGGSGRAVVVPLLLSGGYHVEVDIAEAVADHDGQPGQAVASPALGPDPRLVDLLAHRLTEAGVRPHDAVVVAAAGSSRSGAARDVERVADGLRDWHPGPVTVGYGAKARPSVPEAVAAARAALADASGPEQREGDAATPRVVVAAYLLAPGYFYDRVLEAGADVVTAPLGADPRLTSIVLDRYDSAAVTLDLSASQSAP